jgi:hypothetical protein
MIRRPDTFPDVDDAIAQAATQPPPPTQDVLEYRRRDPHDDQEDGAFTMLAATMRRLAFAAALASVAGGFGFVFAVHESQAIAAFFMGLGAGVLGLILPIPGSTGAGGRR